MVGLLRASWHTPGLRTKLPLAVLAVVVYRLGHHVPSPGVDVRAVRGAADAAVRDDPFVALVDLVSGGGLLRLSMLGLGVFPCVAAVAVVHLLTQVHPRTRALRTEGKEGAARLGRYVLVLTAVWGALMATALVVAAGTRRLPGGDVLASTGGPTVVAMVGAMTAGAVVTALLVRVLSGAAFGAGAALLFFVQVAAVFGGQLAEIREVRGTVALIVAVGVVALAALVVVVSLVVVGQAQRRVPVQYPKGMPVRRPAKTVYVPIRVCAVGAFPVRLALVLLFLPALVARLWPGGGRPGGVWTLPQQDSAWFLLALFALVVLVFPVSVAGTFDPGAIADRLHREGAFVPGIRPGRPTAQYLSYVNRRITVCAPIVLGAAAVFPSAALALAGLGSGLALTGVSVLILVTAGTGLALQLGRATETRIQVQRFAPFLR